MSGVHPSWPGCAIRELPGGGREFDPVDRELTYIGVDHQARLQFGDAELVIETPFELRAGDHVQTLDPNDRAGLGPGLALYPATNIKASMSPEGTLQVTFGRVGRCDSHNGVETIGTEPGVADRAWCPVPMTHRVSQLAT